MKKLNSDLEPGQSSSFTVGVLVINYPGKKEKGDYQLTINGKPPKHTDIVTEIYNQTNPANLNEIISPFSRGLSLKYLDLTPKQIQIANLIKIGKSTKEIAELMNISPRTVDTHRKNIRRKIGLEEKRASLRSRLISM